MPGAKSSQRRARILNTTKMFQGPVFDVVRESVFEPGGIRATRDIVVHSGSVVVLPVFASARVLLIRQYRHAVGDFLWELVAGRKEPDESPTAAARRELLEETGYTARRLRKLLDVFPTPGFVSERMWVFAAEGLTEGPAQPEEDERIVRRVFTLRQVDAMIRRGKLRDAKSVAGLLYYIRYIQHLR
jgi:ADP-ribose pyrophosphatase